MNKHTLVVTKNDKLFAQIAASFADQEWLTHRLTTAAATYEWLNRHKVDILIWDLELTTLDTSLATINIINKKINGPIIALSSNYKISTFNKLLGVHVDDLLQYPLDLNLLINIIKQRYWRQNYQYNEHIHKKTYKKKVIANSEITLDPEKHKVIVRGKYIELTPKEFHLLKYLLDNRKQVLSREQLMKGVWGYDIPGTTRIVDIHISHLRDKLEVNPQKPQILKTVRGFGYILDL